VIGGAGGVRGSVAGGPERLRRPPLRDANRGADGRPIMYNLVGMQTRLRRGGQLKALRLVPGLR